MQKRILAYVLTTALGLSLSGVAFAAIGPTQTNLKVTAMYTINASGAIYVQFQSGAMPGCYGNAGGYLYASNPYFKELNAQLLLMIATGGVRASVVYTQNTPTNNWDDCTMEGLYLQPQ